MSSSMSSTISSTIQSLISDVFSGLQYIADGIVDFIKNNYFEIGILAGVAIILSLFIRDTFFNRDLNSLFYSYF